jgi:membrane protease YdiL (CAAX protease family)
MRRLWDLLAVIGFSIGGVLLFYIPELGTNDDINGIISYSLIAATFFYITWSYKLPSLAYFRLPELTVPSFAGLIVVVCISWGRITSDRVITLPLWPTITGIVYIFTIGMGEELLSRGFAFGVFKKYGTFFAIFFSSLFFGLMHINVYIGDDWDPVQAYWHCVSAFGFGILCSAIMIVCRSIIAPIVMHALYDWTVVFAKPVKPGVSDEDWVFDPLWQTLKDSFAEISINLFFALLLLAIWKLSRIRKFPRFLRPVLMKLGLVDEVKPAAY